MYNKMICNFISYHIGNNFVVTDYGGGSLNLL